MMGGCWLVAGVSGGGDDVEVKWSKAGGGVVLLNGVK